MKSALVLVLASLSTLAVASHVIVPEPRQSSSSSCDPNGWVQNPSGCATFTSAHNCATPSCGVNFTSGFTSAVNELAFGSNHSFGDACGRCFQITATADPFNSSYQGPFGKTIIVKVNNLCLNGPTSQHNWCGQTVSKPKNEFNASMHFDLCDLTGAPQAFFPPGLLAMRGVYQEVPCTLWQGSEGTPLWNGTCMADENAALWPTPACGNEGSAPC
ncbi:endoglucanase V-like protein [Russula decolorans]